MSTDPDLPTLSWLRRARWAAVLAAVVCSVVGLVWVYRAATAGDVLGAAAGAALCLGVIALDAALAAALRLGGLTLRCLRRTEQLEARLGALETDVDLEAQAAKLIADENARAAGLVAASLEHDTFPRLSIPDEDEGSALEGDIPADAGPAGADSSAAGGQQELDRLVHREMTRLREEFAEHVRRGDYAAALATGERIAALFPDSTLAAEFEAIREHVARRAAAAEKRRTDERASAG